MGNSSLAGVYKIAADVNKDNSIKATDYVFIKNSIMGIYEKHGSEAFCAGRLHVDGGPDRGRDAGGRVHRRDGVHDAVSTHDAGVEEIRICPARVAVGRDGASDPEPRADQDTAGRSPHCSLPLYL